MFKAPFGISFLSKAANSFKDAVRGKKPESDRSIENINTESPTEISEPIQRLDPATIPKFVNPLEKPPVFMPFTRNIKFEPNDEKCHETWHEYTIDICEFEEQILPEGFPKTRVWGYGGPIKDPESGLIRYSRSAPGATFEAVRGIPVTVNWRNILTGRHLFAVDPTLHWANPNGMPMHPPMPWPAFPPGFPDAQFPVPAVTHLHGGEVSSLYDGNPDAWFTFNGMKGSAYAANRYFYPNNQEPATLWYHDHALGITRLNVYAGLAGFYLLRGVDDSSLKEFELPEGKYEIPIVIQDRSFGTDGSFLFPQDGINPEIHPYWTPEFFGDTIMVNGKVWPDLKAERRQYRFRLLNGSNARFYNLKMSNGMGFIQIGTDGGFLKEPVVLDTLLIAPGERADILVDFSGVEPGTSIILMNDANAPFPDGDPPDPDTVGKIMQFTVPADSPEPVKPPELPCRLNHIVALIPDSPERILTLNEVMGPNGPVEILLNGQMWSAAVSELPRVGSTEEWIIVNLTVDAHPIHLHLTQFQIFNRQDFMVEEYRVKWEEINGMPPLDHPTSVLPVEPYLIGEPIPPDRNEMGWKDTIKVYPNQITRIRVRYAPQDVPVCDVKPGENLYPFDPSCGPGYVWHCHILDHEDNEMMRPLKVQP